jgi:hypothetical protein
MTLSKREKVLAVCVGFVAVFFGGRVLWGVVAGPILDRRDILSGIEKQIDEKDELLQEAKAAEARMADWRKTRSLPGNVLEAQSQYWNWLLGLAKENFPGLKLEMAKKVDAKAAASAKGKAVSYNALTYNLKGQGSLSNLIQFLYKFYSVGYLHQVRTLNINPVPKSTDLTVTMQVEALSLPGAEAKEKLDLPKRPLAVELAAYTKDIVDRKPFSPPERPKPPPPPGDDNPPPPRPAFDITKFTQVTGIVVGRDGQPEVMIKAHTLGKEFRLHQGDPLIVGQFKATIGQVGDRDVEILIAGRTDPVRIPLGGTITKNDEFTKPSAEPAPPPTETKGRPPVSTGKAGEPGAKTAEGPTYSKDFVEKVRAGKGRGKKGGRGGFGPGGSSPEGGDTKRKRGE